MEKRETSASKRQKLVHSPREFPSRFVNDSPLYEKLDILYPYLNLSDVDTLVAVSHSMRHSVFKSGIVDYVKTLLTEQVKVKQEPNLVLMHEIYELHESRIIPFLDYVEMLPKLKELQTPMVLQYTAMEQNDPELKRLFSRTYPSESESTAIIFHFVMNNGPLGILSCHHADLKVTYFNRFNWNDRKKIFMALKEAGIAFEKKIIVDMAKCGEPIEHIQRISTIATHGLGNISFGKKNYNPETAKTNLRNLADWPKLVCCVIEYFLTSDPFMLQSDQFPYEITMLQKLPFTFGEFFVQNASAFLQKANYWFFTAVCKLPYFQIDGCCNLWKRCHSRKKYRTIMIQHTPIVTYLSKLSTSKELVQLIKELDEQQLKKFWNTEYPQLPIERRADVLYDYYTGPPPNHLYIPPKSKIEYTAYRESPSLAIYLLRCEMIRTNMLQIKLENHNNYIRLNQIPVPSEETSKKVIKLE